MQEIRIKRFFECLIPVTICNLKCSYCYVIQRDYRYMKLADMKYSPEHIGKCLTVQRLGGVCFFSICGAGETLAQPETLQIAHELLKNGHIVNITTNGTLRNRLKEIENFTLEERERLHFSFSFHYLELCRTGLLESFFENIKYCKNQGCSFVVQLNLCDEYIPYIEDIKKICKEKLGAYPQVAATRKESADLTKFEFMTNLQDKEYIAIGKTFDSPLFEYTIENFNVKRNEFCYAGQRSGTLDLSTGILHKCYADPKPQKIFEDPTKKIIFEPIGNNCNCAFCLNSSHFMSLGVIENNDSRTYCSLRDRLEAAWFNPTVKYALSQKLGKCNENYGINEQKRINRKQRYINCYYKIRRELIKIVKAIIKREQL